MTRDVERLKKNFIDYLYFVFFSLVGRGGATKITMVLGCGIGRRWIINPFYCSDRKTCFPFLPVSFHSVLFPLFASDRLVVGKTAWYGGKGDMSDPYPLHSLEVNFCVQCSW